MKFINEIRVGDLIGCFGLVFAGAGLILNWYQMWRNAKQKRAEFIVGLLFKYLEDPDAAKMFYKLEYGDFKYTEDFHGSPDELALDKLLFHFERIAAARQLGAVSREDLELLAYELQRTYHNPEVQNYFTFLDRWDKLRQGRERSFNQFRTLLEKELSNHRTKRISAK